MLEFHRLYPFHYWGMDSLVFLIFVVVTQLSFMFMRFPSLLQLSCSYSYLPLTFVAARIHTLLRTSLYKDRAQYKLAMCVIYMDDKLLLVWSCGSENLETSLSYQRPPSIHSLHRIQQFSNLLVFYLSKLVQTLSRKCTRNPFTLATIFISNPTIYPSPPPRKQEFHATLSID
jgi:hypothetical protein